MADTMTYEYGDNLYINMTNMCPNNCEFCLRNNSSGSIYSDNLWYNGKEPTKEAIWTDLLARDLSKYSSIVFCGYGEPTCRLDDLLWIAEKIKGCGDYRIRINTNGLSDLINNCDSTEKMLGLIDTVSVSLNADTAEKYEALCHSDFGLEAYPAILRFTAKAVEKLPHVRMTVVSTMPKEEIENCRRICEELGAEFMVREYIDK